jgi:putative redox protein
MTGIDSRGNPLVVGTWPEHNPPWLGLKASDLLLLSAASCASYDVIEILAKQRQPLQGLEVSCTGEQESEPPYKFVHIHLHYLVRGDIAKEKVVRAIQLSEDKYCCVTNTLRDVVKITSDFEVVRQDEEP